MDAANGPSDAELTWSLALAERVALRLDVGADAQDVAAETAIRLLRSWKRVHLYADAWVTTVATNLSIDHHRKHRAPRQDPAATRSFEDQTLDRIALVDELRALPRRQREVLVLRHLLGLSDAETAAALGLSVSTVRTHAARSMRSLRQTDPVEQDETPTCL